jgi:hypothetical protein
MPLPRTSELRAHVSGEVGVVYPHASDPAGTITIILPEGYPDPLPYHWRANHSETFRVSGGRAEVEVDGVVKIIGPDNDPVQIPAGCVYKIRRADWRAQKKDEKDKGRVMIQFREEPGKRTVTLSSIIIIIIKVWRANEPN